MQELIPITLFICTAYAIHAIADARARSKLVAQGSVAISGSVKGRHVGFVLPWRAGRHISA